MDNSLSVIDIVILYYTVLVYLQYIDLDNRQKFTVLYSSNTITKIKNKSFMWKYVKKQQVHI